MLRVGSCRRDGDGMGIRFSSGEAQTLKLMPADNGQKGAQALWTTGR